MYEREAYIRQSEGELDQTTMEECKELIKRIIEVNTKVPNLKNYGKNNVQQVATQMPKVATQTPKVATQNIKSKGKKATHLTP